MSLADNILSIYSITVTILLIICFWHKKRLTRKIRNLIGILHHSETKNKKRGTKISLTKQQENLKNKIQCLFNNNAIKTDPAFNHMIILNEIGYKIISSLDIKNVIENIYNSINSLLDADLMAVAIINKKNDYLDIWGIEDVQKSAILGHINLNDSQNWSVISFTQQREIFHNTPPKNPEGHFSKKIFKNDESLRKSFIFLPLSIHEKNLGVFSIQSFKAKAYSEYQFNILKGISFYISIAIENAISYKQIADQKEKILEKTEQLKTSHQQLEDLVKQRTKEVIRQRDEIIRKNEVLLKKQDEILQQSKKLRQLSIVAEKTGNAIMIMDATGTISWVNDCFTRLYEYTLEEFIEARGDNIRKTSFNQDIINSLDYCIQTKKPVTYEAMNITKSGQSIWTHTSLTPIVDEKNNIINLITIDSDITERKIFEKEILRKNQQITESIRYASKIQNALLPSKNIFKHYLQDFFIFFKPKSIVSGDFYWAVEKQEKLIVVAADCTGHGVPGAFMSMLGISYLNEIVNKSNILTASQILDTLRGMIKKSLHQTGDFGEAKDGMDIALCIIDKKNNEIQYAGAYNPLYIIRDKQLYEFKADNMPVGIHLREKASFSNNIIEIQKDDMFYIFSDGYASQFGGENSSKFNKRRLKELFLNTAPYSCKKQKEIVDNTLKDWTQNPNSEQVDDILILGFKVK